MQIVEEWGCEYNLEIYLICRLRNWVGGSLDRDSNSKPQLYSKLWKSRHLQRLLGLSTLLLWEIVWNKLWERAVGRQIAGIGTIKKMQTDWAFNTFALSVEEKGRRTKAETMVFICCIVVFALNILTATSTSVLSSDVLSRVSSWIMITTYTLGRIGGWAQVPELIFA